MVNEKLLAVITDEKMKEMGFVKKDDGSGDPRGVLYSIENNNFALSVDQWAEVTLYRRNPDTDQITLHCETLFDLRCAVNWIQ